MIPFRPLPRADMEAMLRRKIPTFASSDPLDLGEALWLAHWASAEEPWAQLVQRRSLTALEALWAAGEFAELRRRRLAFREFGTTIGVQVTGGEAAERWAPRVRQIHRDWREHLTTRDRDITPVRAPEEGGACLYSGKSRTFGPAALLQQPARAPLRPTQQASAPPAFTIRVRRLCSAPR